MLLSHVREMPEHHQFVDKERHQLLFYSVIRSKVSNPHDVLFGHSGNFCKKEKALFFVFTANKLNRAPPLGLAPR